MKKAPRQAGLLLLAEYYRPEDYFVKMVSSGFFSSSL
jgi:hypothetical protein